jgi:hypothetical protein
LICSTWHSVAALPALPVVHRSSLSLGSSGRAKGLGRNQPVSNPISAGVHLSAAFFLPQTACLSACSNHPAAQLQLQASAPFIHTARLSTIRYPNTLTHRSLNAYSSSSSPLKRRAPLWRLAPKRFLYFFQISFTNSRLPSTAPSVKYLTRHRT